jgi:hypothetical protein
MIGLATKEKKSYLLTEAGTTLGSENIIWFLKGKQGKLPLLL